MTRQGPSESATIFPVGTKKRGNDGNNWIVIQTKNSKRWSKLNNNTLQKTKKISKTKKTKNYTIKKSKKNDISVDKLRQLLKKYNASFNGSKEAMAQKLFRLRRATIENADLELIYNLLDKDQQKKATQLIKDRINKPITNYRGMYEPPTKPISLMTREELIKKLQKFRDSWEKITTRDQDLSDERLNGEPTDQLRNLIKFYYSDDAKFLAEEWLRNYV
uniref:SAP domain-containing protein n=1 Tax=viral metagenome TaxID=1070528 RepID=A0A6C0D564_9ZZZZ